MIKPGLMVLAVIACIAGFPGAVSQGPVTSSFFCSSSTECTLYLNNGSMSSSDVLFLATDIGPQPGTCIEFSSVQNLTLNCTGHAIDVSAPGPAILLDSARNITVTGCMIHGQGTAIQLIGSQDCLIYDNLFNSSGDAGVQGGGMNFWNIPRTCTLGQNIVGRSCKGGNYWTGPSGNYSDECFDLDLDDFCDAPFSLDLQNIDSLPVASIPPAPTDTDPPDLVFSPPTPENMTGLSQDWVFINATADEALQSCTLDWNGTNQTLSPSGISCWANMTGLAPGSYTFRLYASDPAGNINGTEPRLITVSGAADSMTPLISEISFYPPVLIQFRSVLIGINATDNQAVSSLWANITEPDGTSLILWLANNAQTPWLANKSGIHSVRFFVNDTSSNTVTATASFNVSRAVNYNLTLLNRNQTGVSSELDVYLAGTGYRLYSGSRPAGNFSVPLGEGSYDIVILAFSDMFELFLRGVNITSGFNGSMAIDNVRASETFDEIFGVQTNYSFSGAMARIYYDLLDYDNESAVHAFRCANWNFSSGSCTGSWDLISGQANSRTGDYVEFNITSFSAFGIREDSYCGDGWCGPGETSSSCPGDCACTEGETRPCSISRQGRCATGEETCLNNGWTGCPVARTETCNRQDDDCNGIVDDVGGGTSVQATGCQCFGNGSPGTETCNGIDDDCDSLVDNNADCCTAGQTRECGPSTEEGLCQRGTNPCTGGTWGSCVGAVYPVEEVCGNGLDEDCDGETDENCDFSPCPEGAIATRCICEGSARTSGYCCAGFFSDIECAQNPYWILIPVGILILILLAFLALKFRSQGRQLTWEELTKKYTPAARNFSRQ